MENENWKPGDLPDGFNWGELYRDFIGSRSVYHEYKRRKHLARHAKKVLEEYRNMSEEEQEKEKEKRDFAKDQYTIEKLEKIEKIVEEEGVDLPEGYKRSSVRPVPAADYKRIAQTLFHYFNPTEDAPNWSKAQDTLSEEYDINVETATLKKHWDAIQEQDAYAPLKRAMAWQVIDRSQETFQALFDHAVKRVIDEDEGGEYDSILERVRAIKELAEVFKNMPTDQPDKSQIDKRVSETVNEVTFEPYSEEQEEDTEQGETIDVEREETDA